MLLVLASLASAGWLCRAPGVHAAPTDVVQQVEGIGIAEERQDAEEAAQFDCTARLAAIEVDGERTCAPSTCIEAAVSGPPPAAGDAPATITRQPVRAAIGKKCTAYTKQVCQICGPSSATCALLHEDVRTLAEDGCANRQARLQGVIEMEKRDNGGSWRSNLCRKMEPWLRWRTKKKGEQPTP